MQHDAMSLVYLVVLLSILISINWHFLYRYRGRLIAQCLAWLVMIFSLILIYSYRYHFDEFYTRIRGELLPQYAVIHDDGSMSVQESDDGHYYIKALVNSHEVTFLIDTGASDIVLAQEDAQQIGIKTDTLYYNKRYNTANGVAYAASVELDVLNIGGLRFTDVPASVISSSTPYSVLGMRFLSQFRYQFDKGRFTLWFNTAHENRPLP